MSAFLIFVIALTTCQIYVITPKTITALTVNTLQLELNTAATLTLSSQNVIGQFWPLLHTKSTTNVIVVSFPNITHIQSTSQNVLALPDFIRKFVYLFTTQAVLQRSTVFVHRSIMCFHYTMVASKRKKKKSISSKLEGKESNNLLLLILTIVKCSVFQVAIFPVLLLQ